MIKKIYNNAFNIQNRNNIIRVKNFTFKKQVIMLQDIVNKLKKKNNQFQILLITIKIDIIKTC